MDDVVKNDTLQTRGLRLCWSRKCYGCSPLRPLEALSLLHFLACSCPTWGFVVMDHVGPAFPEMLFFPVGVSRTFALRFQPYGAQKVSNLCRVVLVQHTFI